MIYVEAFKGTGKTMPKVRPVARPTDILRERARQVEQQHEARSAFREMVKDAIAAGHLPTSPEEG